MEAALAGWRRMKPTNQFWALQDINFCVAKGQMLGILGHNGAGKSTLLQLIGGVGRPDTGRVKTQGRIGALLDLGAGFHVDLTGRENIFVAAISSGLTRQEVRRRMQGIIEFAELEAFIDSPLRTYSTGMQMRLGFSVAVHTAPDILLIDEHLSVGDQAFQAKCIERISQLKSRGCAIVLISQSAEQVKSLCDQALWLEQGRIVAHGDPPTIASRYATNMDAKSLPKPHPTYSREVEILSAYCLDENLQEKKEFRSGDALVIAIDYFTHRPISNCIFVVSISNTGGEIYFNTHTDTEELLIPLEFGQGEIRLWLERLDLSGGEYFINVGIFSETWDKTYDYKWHQYPLKLQWTPGEDSIITPPKRWEITNSKEHLKSTLISQASS
ncbi:MAG: ABC transporter ATP-binding protein [Leptolyngbya sp. DLM2.Bin27]|nr:MAG: ABC transporter ATP-binding protein [Leptolyngbya sp. DLM2.Bin27]